MNKTEAVEKTIETCRSRNMAFSTERTYAHWVGKFAEWKRQNPSEGLQEWLSGMAPSVAPKTQAQALNAVVFFYKRVLEKEVGKLDFKPACRNRKIPDFLTERECHLLFGQMNGVAQLQAQLMFGAGLRKTEMLSIRVKDLDFESFTITVRNGKGGKDRVVPLPRSLSADLKEQCEKARYWWDMDQKQGNPPPYLPNSLLKKLGSQTAEFGWFWIFPANNLSVCPRSGVRRRHHITDRCVSRALKVAASRAGIMKRVHPHVLRHSFATSLLRNGMDIRSLASLMGHKSTETTEIYLHCLPDIGVRAVSPLDISPSNVVSAAFREDDREFRNIVGI